MSDDKPPPQPGDLAHFEMRQVLAMYGLYTFPDTILTREVTAQKAAARQAASDKAFYESLSAWRNAGKDSSNSR